MSKPLIPLKGGDEQDMLSPWRKVLKSADRLGMAKKAKRSYNKRVRRNEKEELMSEEAKWEGNPLYYRPNRGTMGNYPSPFEGDSQRLKEDCKTYLPRDHYDLPEEIEEWDQDDWDYFVHRNDD